MLWPFEDALGLDPVRTGAWIMPDDRPLPAGLSLIDEKGDCFAVGEANHRELFRRVAAVVHHGGAGTTAALAGAPQVIVPQILDQPYWAQRVAELGIGAGQDGPTATVESLSTALETALRDDTAARAEEVSTTIAPTVRRWRRRRSST